MKKSNINFSLLGDVEFSKYQKDFFNAIKNTNGHISVEATAGSGKTFSILTGLKLVPRFRKTIFLSFSNGIVDTLKSKVPVGVQASTLHSIGMRFVTSYYPGIRVNPNKYSQLALNLYGQKTKETFKKAYNIQDISSYVRMTLTALEIDEVEKMCDKYDINYTTETIEKTIELIQQNEDYPSSIDFADMVFMPAVNEDIVQEQFDFVFLDEAQDCSKAQIQFVQNILKPNTGRLISVGDSQQCQPEGTKIQMADMSIKNIEDIEIGDFVTSYDKVWRGGYCFYYKSKIKHDAIKKNSISGIIEDKVKRNYSGNLFSITTENNITTKYTKEHRCCFKFSDNIDSKKRWVVYLMQKGNRFRIGSTVLWGTSKTNSGFGLSVRCNSERADFGWMLEIFDTKEEARVYEQLYSYKFGIPQFIFKDPRKNKQLLCNQGVIDRFWSLIDSKELLNKSINCLEYFNKDINYPLYINKNLFKGDNGIKFTRNSKHLMFYTQSCNLFPEIMDVSEFDSKNIHTNTRGDSKIKHKWSKIKSIKIDNVENLPVYSLKVSGTELYIGDGILTHNSIYSFSGGDIDAFKTLKKIPNTIELPLSISYRCSKRVVEQARKISKKIESNKGAEEGVVRNGFYDEIKEGDMVLCRNNAPLIDMYFRLIEDDIKAKIYGKDIEKGIVKIAEKCMAKYIEKFIENLYEELDNVLNELIKKGVRNPDKHLKYGNMADKVELLEIIANKVNSTAEIIPLIKNMFVDNESEGVKLMTIHKSKGMENDRVFILDKYKNKQLIPSQYATQKWQIEQEKNLEFVAITRAKNELIYFSIE